MKKSIKIIAGAVAALMLCLTLVSCDLFGKKLDGKYEYDAGILGTTTLDFDGKNVTVKKEILGTVTKWEGTYEIDDDTISFTFVDEDGEELEDAPFSAEAYTFEEDEDSGDITIGNVEYEKLDD